MEAGAGGALRAPRNPRREGRGSPRDFPAAAPSSPRRPPPEQHPFRRPLPARKLPPSTPSCSPRGSLLARPSGAVRLAGSRGIASELRGGSWVWRRGRSLNWTPQERKGGGKALGCLGGRLGTSPFPRPFPISPPAKIRNPPPQIRLISKRYCL